MWMRVCGVGVGVGGWGGVDSDSIGLTFVQYFL